MYNKKVIGPGAYGGGGGGAYTYKKNFLQNVSKSMCGRLKLIWTKKILKKNYVGTKKTWKIFQKKKT